MEDLEAKLKNVLNELSSKLEKQEVSVDEFDRDLFELMNEKKIFTGTYSENCYNIGLKSFVSIYIKEEDVSQGRREHLVGYLLNLLYSKFRIVSGLHHRIGEYERREIDD